MRTISEIAHSILKIETLETSYKDDKDFHEFSIWTIKEALEAAYEVGQLSTAEELERRAKEVEQLATSLAELTDEIQKDSSNTEETTSPLEKMQIYAFAFDRGIVTINEVREAFGLPEVTHGDKRYILGQYALILDEENNYANRTG